jgi:hypothetical protein
MAQFEYIVIDGIIIIALSFVMTLSRPLHELQPQRPTSSLLGNFAFEPLFKSHTKDHSFTKQKRRTRPSDTRPRDCVLRLRHYDYLPQLPRWSLRPDSKTP